MHWLSGQWIKGDYCRRRRLGICRAIAPKSVAEERRILAFVYGQVFSWSPFQGFLRGELPTSFRSLVEVG